ncbi:MAG: 30S ribosomal protein S6 [Gammaproteobacteria bacterium]
MKHYEIILLVHPDRADQASAICDKISELVSLEKGKVHRREDIGRRTLAYSIDGLQKAHYVLMNIECSVVAHDKIEDYLKFSGDVLRRLIVRTKLSEMESSSLLVQTQNERERSMSSAQMAASSDQSSTEPESSPRKKMDQAAS